MARQRKRRADKSNALRKASIKSLAHVPSEWRGRFYRRLEIPTDPTARKRVEEQARSHCAKEVLGVLLEAKLPFAEMGANCKGGLDVASALRCCRAMRLNSFKQKVTDWRPCRHWLLAEGLGFFPTGLSTNFTVFFWLFELEGER